MDFEPPSPNIATLNDLSDDEVLAALQGGRISALDVLYRRHAKQAYSLAYRILSSAEEAEDVTQEVFLTLWQKNAYQSTRGSLKSFLLTMTRSRAIDKLRNRGTRYRFLQRWQRLSEGEHGTTPPLEDISANEQIHRVQQALAQLSENERQVLEIAYYEGISQAEIAKRLNLPLGTVKSRSRQGLHKLRQHLQQLP